MIKKPETAIPTETVSGCASHTTRKKEMVAMFWLACFNASAWNV